MQRIRGVVAALLVAVGLGLGFESVSAPTVAAADQPTTAISARLQLARTTVGAGRTVRGNLVLTNHTKKAVDLTRTCTPKWDVVPGRGRKAPAVAFSQICGVSAFSVPPGTEKLSFTIATTGLRTGKYHAFLVASDPAFPTAQPAPFTIVKAS